MRETIALNAASTLTFALMRGLPRQIPVQTVKIQHIAKAAVHKCELGIIEITVGIDNHARTFAIIPDAYVRHGHSLRLRNCSEEQAEAQKGQERAQSRLHRFLVL